LAKLNKEQRQAADFVDGICAVIAVPGSGKTLTMVERIKNLVTKHGIPPESILGLTFTRNAAEAMKTRLVPVLDDKAERVMLSTIHSFCLHVLKREGKVFEILTGKDQIIFLRKIMTKLGVKNLSVGMVLSEVSLARNNLISVEEFRVLYEGDKTMLQVADVFEAYDQKKEKKFLMDFDDLLLGVYRLLTERPEIKEKYSDIFRHLLVDEFQDTNPLQMEVIKLLCDGSISDSSLWVCGDDWQSIYAFNGASVGNILNFKETFPDSQEFILSVNYRSTPQIIRACQNLISHNERKIDKALKTNNPDGEDLIILECSSEEDEALNIVNQISDLNARGYQYKDIAVLYRANFQSRIIEEAFSQHGIPYRIENGLNFYNRREVKVLLDYLRLIASSDSAEGDEALLNVINIPNRYIGKKFIREIEQYAGENDLHLYQALKSMPIDIRYVKKNVKELVEFLDSLMADFDSTGPALLIQLLRDILDYDRFITDDDIPCPDDVKIQNINQLQLAAAKYEDIESFLEYTGTFQDESINDKNGVGLMTIHKAKGLEFPVVFVVGLVEGILPTKRGETEEERRICFVGISRAMNLLYLSHSHTYLGQPSKKSIFLDEMLGNRKNASATS